MRVGEKLDLELLIAPDNADDSDLVWSTSDTSIARVDASGHITAVGAGRVVIAAKANGCVSQREINVVPDIRMDMLGAGICITEPYGIRFATRIAKNNAWESTDVVEYGTLIIAKKGLSGAPLTLGTEKALRIPSTRVHSEDETSFTFTGKLSGIPKESFDTRLIARAYVIYRNASGGEEALYSNQFETSFNEVADTAMELYSTMPEDDKERSDVMAKLNELLYEQE